MASTVQDLSDGGQEPPAEAEAERKPEATPEVTPAAPVEPSDRDEVAVVATESSVCEAASSSRAPPEADLPTEKKEVSPQGRYVRLEERLGSGAYKDV